MDTLVIARSISAMIRIAALIKINSSAPSLVRNSAIPSTITLRVAISCNTVSLSPVINFKKVIPVERTVFPTVSSPIGCCPCSESWHPIQGISFKISEMYAKLEASRLLMLRAARMLDDGLNATKEVAAAKFTAAVNQMDIVLDSMQIFGGIGYTKEFPLEQLLRDSKISQISAGTVEILKFLCQREIYKALNL